ncbi:MAG: hypothetical protein V3U11_06895 [Planctomycetota bacterium]
MPESGPGLVSAGALVELMVSLIQAAAVSKKETKRLDRLPAHRPCAGILVRVSGRRDKKTPSEPDTVREPGPAARALDYASKYFMGKADVQQAALRLVARLEELEIPHAIAGGLAVSAHGHVRVTVDVDVVLTAEGLRRFKEESLGRGWVETFQGSKGVRDTQHNVRIDVLVTGDYPGDGQPKPVRFPDPVVAGIAMDNMSFVSLPCLIELKLASGISAPDRLQDLADVISLIRANVLAKDFGANLDDYVRQKYEELWEAAQLPEGEY